MTGIQPLSEGTLLEGRYRILQTLGRGSMGTVYRAKHLSLDTIVAIKEVRGLTAAHERTEAAPERCQQEAQLLSHLNHPHLPKVYDAFIAEERFYLVMELIEGVTLADTMRRRGRPLETEHVLRWGMQLADVLHYLHSQSPPIIFRDLKPANVMVQPDDSIRLIDFGIARRFQSGASTDTAPFGSVGYAPPEQFGQQQTDARSDIYAFGAMLHHLLTGQNPSLQPFRFQPANALNPTVPAELARLLEQCLSFHPEARPASMETVLQALDVLRQRPQRAPFYQEQADSDTARLLPVVGRSAVFSAGWPWQNRERDRKKEVTRTLAALTLTVLSLGTLMAFRFQTRQTDTERRLPVLQPVSAPAPVTAAEAEFRAAGSRKTATHVFSAASFSPGTSGSSASPLLAERPQAARRSIGLVPVRKKRIPTQPPSRKHSPHSVFPEAAPAFSLQNAAHTRQAALSAPVATRAHAGRTVPTETARRGNTIPEQAVLNINTASVEELERLPGIGPVLAGRIVAYREEKGLFAETGDLLCVAGIGEKRFRQLQLFVCVR